MSNKSPLRGKRARSVGGNPASPPLFDTKADHKSAVDGAMGAEATTSKKAEASADTATIPTPVRPNPKAQRSFTDPESRMMKTNDGFHYAYNAQAVVDEGSSSHRGNQGNPGSRRRQ